MNLVSDTLRFALREVGWAKLAEAANGHRIGPSLTDAVAGLATKTAADAVNDAVVRDGLAALARIREAAR